MRLLFSSSLLALLVACHNPCQDLCKEIASYAEDCGITVPDDAVSTCIDDNSRDQFEREELRICRQNAEYLQDEWTCDDVALYFD
ncbi:MAG: hypothetical protein H6741_07935 [Alphaproteobacteria bacterium]|nr:hypothetical protein [Alphaproteobacteria bacterium]